MLSLRPLRLSFFTLTHRARRPGFCLLLYHRQSATQGTPALTHLDARRGETPVAADAVAAIRVACPSLRCVLTNLEPSP